MKIAILTFTEGTNIGQRLQNYALQKKISDIGYEVYTIKQGYPFNKYKRIVRCILQWFCHPKRENIKRKREKKFKQFNCNYIKFYKKIMPFYGCNKNFANEFDQFIVGSDQIWNPYSPYVGDNYFLKFADYSQRYTYAASFSVDRIPDEHREEYVERLQGFGEILVREQQGGRIVKELTGKDAKVVLDPTLLLDLNEWNKVKKACSIKPKNKYILAMFLGDKPMEDIRMIDSNTDAELLMLDSMSIIGPDEFLDVISDAELVLTDSYHITIFSIIYHRPFINFFRTGTNINMNSRFETLYSLLGIENRQWSYLKEHMSEIDHIEYDNIDKKILFERERSKSILYHSIGRIER